MSTRKQIAAALAAVTVCANNSSGVRRATTLERVEEERQKAL